MKNKQALNLISNILTNSIKKDRTCLFPDCNKKSISSHLLQKNGILDTITENNHVYTLYTNHQTNETKFKFTGRNEAFTFKGYCQEHDNSLFKDIERDGIDFSSPRNALLFTFRALFNEYRKKQVINEGFKNVLKSNLLNVYIDRPFVEEFVKNNELGERDLKYHLDIAHRDYIRSSTGFEYAEIKLPRIPICVSAAISVETDEEMLNEAKKDIIKWKSRHLPALILNLFPLKTESILLIAYPKKDSERIVQFVNKNIKPIVSDRELKLVSDLIVKYIETWACSPSFYNKNIRKNENEIIKYIRKTSNHHTAIAIPFNIFEGI